MINANLTIGRNTSQLLGNQTEQCFKHHNSQAVSHHTRVMNNLCSIDAKLMNLDACYSRSCRDSWSMSCKVKARCKCPMKVQCSSEAITYLQHKIALVKLDTCSWGTLESHSSRTRVLYVPRCCQHTCSVMLFCSVISSLHYTDTKSGKKQQEESAVGWPSADCEIHLTSSDPGLISGDCLASRCQGDHNRCQLLKPLARSP